MKQYITKITKVTITMLQDGELAVRTMGVKAQKGYLNLPDDTKVFAHNAYLEDGTVVKRYGMVNSRGILYKDLTKLELQEELDGWYCGEDIEE